jgi:pimeloyl-ACP methyl ester carboxylesterase
MHDPKLRRRLGRVRIPALVVWGESDGVVDPDYGRAHAQSLPNARFKLIPEAGHVPHECEQALRLLTLVWEFADSIAATRVTGSFEERWPDELIEDDPRCGSQRRHLGCTATLIFYSVSRLRARSCCVR